MKIKSMDFKNFSGIWFFVIIISNVVAGKMSEIEENFDASEITWAHAVNSRLALEKELKGPVDVLEADVSMGIVTGSKFGTVEPIMAHPPANQSDLSLATWLDTVINSGSRKGMKLDFKSLEVVEPSLDILEKYRDKINSTLWLNADILPGPIHSTTTPVNGSDFLLSCNVHFPDAVLSIGWTTNFYTTIARENLHYTWAQVRAMADIIRCFKYQKYPKITFPVRGVFVPLSIRQLKWLMEVVPGSTLTVWSSQSDRLKLEDLLYIRKSFPKHQVYYDVPEQLLAMFTEHKNDTKFESNPSSLLKKDDWMTLVRTKGSGCQSYTYISNGTVMFGKSVTTAALLKKPFIVDQKKYLKIRGRMRFIDDSNSHGGHKISIVLVNVTLLGQNSINGSFDPSASGTDLMWSALNSSRLITFEQTHPETCRIFEIDTAEDHSFQTWSLDCDDMDGEISFDEAKKSGRQEISARKRVVFPTAPFIFGFISKGDGFAVIHDLEISDKKVESKSTAPIDFEIGKVLMTMLVANIILLLI